VSSETRPKRPHNGRVSTRDQNLDRQIDALTTAGCLRVFADKKSKTSARPELDKALDFMRPGDTLVVARYLDSGSTT